MAATVAPLANDEGPGFVVIATVVGAVTSVHRATAVVTAPVALLPLPCTVHDVGLSEPGRGRVPPPKLGKLSKIVASSPDMNDM